MDIEEFDLLLKDFENTNIEFRRDLNTSEDKDRDVKTVSAFYNTRGGKIIYGVTEDGQDRKVVGIEKPQVVENNLVNKLTAKCNLDLFPTIEFIKIGGHTCVLVSCPKGELPPYKANGIPYLRKGSNNIPATQDELASLYRDRSTTTYDRNPIVNGTLDDINLFEVKTFLEKTSNIHPNMPEAELLQLICRIGLLVQINGEFRPTIAGIMLFGCSTQKMLPHARIKADAKFDESSKDWDDIAEIEGTIFEQIKYFEQFVKRNVKVSAQIIGFERIERAQFPEEALREAIINALVHRDYSQTGSEIQFKIRNNSITVDSPGGLIAPLTIEQIISGNFVPKTRNSVIATILNELRYMDKRGSGLIRMSQLMSDFDLPAPEFKEISNGFRVVFNSKPIKDIGLGKELFIPTTELDKVRLDVDHKKILYLIEKNKGVTTKDCVQLLSKTKGAVILRINYLLKHELIEKRASTPTDPNTYYVLHNRFIKDVGSNQIIANSTSQRSQEQLF